MQTILNLLYNIETQNFNGLLLQTDYYIKIPKQKVHTSRSNDLRHVFLCSGDLDLNPVWDQIQFCKHPQAGSDEGITWTTAVMMAVLALFMALLLGLRTH